MKELQKVTKEKVQVRSYLEPEGCFFIARILAKSPRFMGNKNLAAGFLAGFGCAFDENSARVKALGEFFERYFLEMGEKKLERFTLKQARQQKISLLSPNDLRPYHQSHWIENKFPRVNDEQPVSYVLGQDALGQDCFLPARAVFLPFVPTISEPAFMSISATGTAAHLDEEQAKKAALLEVIERHDLMASFRLKDPVWALDINDLPKDILDLLSSNGLKLRLFELGAIPTILAMVTDQNDQRLSIGSKTGARSLEVIKGAIAESLCTRASLKKAPNLSCAPRSSFEHMIQAFNHPKSIISFYEQKSVKRSIVFSQNLGLEEIISQVSKHGPIYFSRLGQYEEWVVMRAIVPWAYSKEGDSLYPHLKRFLERYELSDLNLGPHPFG